MEYNSQKEHLTMPEYGRNIQQLVQHALTIEDKAERQAYAEEIVDLMYLMNPQSRNVDEYKVKLWKHFFKIVGYDIDVEPTEGEKPTPEDDQKRPEKIPYPASQARFRHYGTNVQRLIDKAKSMEEGPVRDGFVEAIGSYMKLAYQTWNKEHYVSDEVIIGDLESLSNGELKLSKDANLNNLASKAPSSGGSSGKKRHSGGRYDKGRRGGGRRRRK